MEALQAVLAPWYLQIKFVHLLSVACWIFSTAVAYLHYLVPAFRAWRRNPDDEGARAMRDWVMDRFDHGAVLEHVAFPLVMISGPALYIAGGWDGSATWLTLKLLIVFGLFLPIEFFDYHLSHLGGNKHRVRSREGELAHERKLQQHWWFFLVTTPLIVWFATIVVFLAVTRPVFGT